MPFCAAAGTGGFCDRLRESDIVSLHVPLTAKPET